MLFANNKSDETESENSTMKNLINTNGKIDARSLHAELGSKRDFSNWIQKRIDECDLIENKDFFSNKFVEKSILSGVQRGRPTIEYDLTISAAKEVAIMERNAKGKEIRRRLIQLEEQHSQGDLITLDEAALIGEMLDFCRFAVNIKRGYELHKRSYVDNSSLDAKGASIEFECYRNQLMNISKSEIGGMLDQYFEQHGRRIKAKTKTLQLCAASPADAIKVAVFDWLKVGGSVESIALRLSRAARHIASARKITIETMNEDTLFQTRVFASPKLLQPFHRFA